jgi:hypothetical protein
MNHTEAQEIIRKQLSRLNALYGAVVFDEWAVLAINANGEAKVVGYEGPRAGSFTDEVAADARALREAGAAKTYAVGDFEFVHDAAGAHLDVFLRLGQAAYLVCNHTAGTMEKVRANTRWRQAQVAWFDLAEAFRADPVV